MIQFAVPDPPSVQESGNRFGSLPDRAGNVMDEMENPAPDTRDEHGRRSDKSKKYQHIQWSRQLPDLPPRRRECDEETKDHQAGDTAVERLEPIGPRRVAHDPENVAENPKARPKTQ